MSRTYLFLAVLISAFITPFMGSSINVAIPSMAETLGAHPMELGWVVTAFLLGGASALLPFGRLADIYGRKRLFLLGTGSVFFLTLACGMAESVEFLLVVRFLQGVAISMIFSTGMAMLISASPPEHRGQVIGYSVTATYTGLSLGPFLGGFITQYLGWRMLFFLTAAVLIVAWLSARRIEGEWYGAKGGHLDLLGSGLSFLGILALLFGLSSYGGREDAPFAMGAGVILLLAFLWRQSRAKEPLLSLSLFENVTFSMSNMAALLHYGATFATGFLLSLYLQVLRGQDAVTAGSILLVQPVMMALLSPWAGRLSDRMAPRIVASFGMGLTAMGLFLLSRLGEATPLFGVIANLMMIGVGFAFFSSPNSNAIMGATPPRQYGIASSIMSLMRMFGQAVSMALVTMLMTCYIVGAPDRSAAVAEALPRIFRLLSGICFLGLICSMLRGSSGKHV